jgi:hypothetical protein
VQVLLAGDNFGCGSSREHAPWALTQWGFRAVISTSFADIFQQNSLKNSLLPIIVPPDVHAELFAAGPGAIVKIDLPNQTLTTPSGRVVEFPVAVDDWGLFRLPVGGGFYLRALPFGMYRVQVEHSGFSPFLSLVEVRSEAPLDYRVTLGVTAVETTVQVSDFDTLLDPHRTGSLNYLGADTLRDIEREVASLHRDRGEAGLTQDAPHPLLARKREWARIVRPNFRQARNVLIRFLQRYHHPWVLPRLAPAGEHHSPVFPQHFTHVCKRDRRVGKEHDAKAGEEQIAASGLESMHSGVRQREFQRQIRRRALACSAQHRRRNIHPKHVTRRADPPPELDRRGTAAAADIDHALPLRRMRSIK